MSVAGALAASAAPSGAIRMIGLSSLSRRAPGICSRHRRVWVLFPVPDSPRKSTARPSRLITDECTATARRSSAAMLNIVHSPKRNSAGLCSGVMSLVASGLPKALWNRAGALPSRGVMVSR